MKNILFVNTGVVWGGVENWHFDTATGLRDMGYNVFVMAFKDTPFSSRCIDAGLNVVTIPRIKDLTFLNLSRIFKLAGFMRRENINLVFFCQEPHFKFVSIAAKLGGVERVVYRRALAKPIKNKFYNRIILKNCVTDILGISKITLDEAVKKLPENIVPNTPLIFNGVKKDKFFEIEKTIDLRKEFNIKDDEFFIVNIGRLCPQKAQTDLIHGVLKLKEKSDLKFKVLMVGRGEDRDKLESLVDELNLRDKIIFAGFRKDIPQFLNQADFMVHTAVYEGCPWTVIEAMVASLPVIAMDISSLPEFVKDNETGFIVEQGNHDLLADKMLYMMNNLSSLDFGKRACEIAVKNYTFDTMIKRIDEIFLSE